MQKMTDQQQIRQKNKSSETIGRSGEICSRAVYNVLGYYSRYLRVLSRRW